jgi:hypothetical protein
VTFSGSFDFPALPSEIPTDDPRVNPAAPGHGYLPPGPDLLERARAASPISYVDPTDPPILMINSAHELAPVAQPESMLVAVQGAGIRARLSVRPGSAHALSGPRIAPYIVQSVVFFDAVLDHDGLKSLLGEVRFRFAHRKLALAMLLVLIVTALAATTSRSPRAQRTR